jgi:hypothetical protein
MKFRWFAALLGLALAGCTASEIGNPGYAPGADAAVLAPGDGAAPVGGPAGAPVYAGSQPGMRMAGAAANGIDAVAGFPAPPANNAGAGNCRTVGNVTTCDAPADPGADDTLYTN